MTLPPFDYREPESLAEALALLREHGDEARLMGGGTALTVMLRYRLVRPGVIVSLAGLPGLAGLHANGDLRIGAMTTHRAIERSPVVRAVAPLLAEACRRVGSPTIRNMGTLGGNLASGEAASDPAPALLALDARVRLLGPEGERVVSLDGFFRDYYETALEPGELVTGVTVPLLPAASGASFVKFLPRTADDYATVAVSATVTLEGDGERCREARIALGAVGMTPLRARAAEAMLAGQPFGESLLRSAGEAVKSAVDPLTDHRGSAAYKREMAAVMVGRALGQAREAAQRAARRAQIH